MREIFRAGSFINMIGGMFVFSVFKPFAGLSYSEAALEIESAVKVFEGEKDIK